MGTLDRARADLIAAIEFGCCCSYRIAFDVIGIDLRLLSNRRGQS